MKMTRAKIKISGTLKLLTGLHIGASSAFAAIGATDSPIIRDTYTGKPLIPGSSIKGKMRSLLASALNERVVKYHNEDDIKIRRLFGDSEEIKTGRLIFRDTILNNEDRLYEKGAQTLTEIKFENTIDRYNAQANPRQIERAIAGSTFAFELIYDVNDVDELEEDFDNIALGFSLLELDYLGGHGSRGYGRVEFNDMKVNVVFGDIADNKLEALNEKLSNKIE